MALTQAALSDYLSVQLGERVAVDWLKQSFPGVSRETWLIKADVSGHEQGFVLRVDAPEGPAFPTSMRREYEIYRRLFYADIPVAEPLWYAESLEFAQGRPHMVRRLVEGSPVIPGLSDPGAEGDALRRTIAHGCIESLAKVHLLDWQAHGFDEILSVPDGPQDALAADFREWRGYWDRDHGFAEPVIDEALCWMAENIPSDSPRISLVKGNNGVGEEIFRENRIVALSDWEGAALSDGVLDLFWSQGTLELIGFDAAVQHYERCVGNTLSIERMAFARLMIFLKAIVCLRCYQYRHFAEGRTTRPYGPSFLVGYSAEVERQLANCIGKSLDEVWDQFGAGARNLYSGMGGSKS